MNVGIINATSYFGIDLIRLLAGHPGLAVTAVTARSQAGKALGEVFPHLRATDPTVATLTLTPDLDGSLDLVFSCLPHAVSAPALLPFIAAGVPVIDVSADFRLNDAAEFKRWYDSNHPAPELLDRTVYGLTEIHRDAIRSTTIVGNPGCYPTATLLALAPAFAASIVEPDVIVDAKSGVSGAGRSLKLDSHYSEVNGSVHAYGVAGHRHSAEMTQELTALAGAPVAVNFVPHLVPMTRGILATCYATLRQSTSAADIAAVYRDFCRDEPFLHYSEVPPRTKWVAGTNHSFLHAVLDQTGRRLVAFGVIDNLVKGAAGQGVQNANLMLGLDETAGLAVAPLYP
ncbi:MAG: N-acetyl-gamma-glutamyl-phosphate reductase [Chloroflexota bacterium]|jgi:N-acetyl-gamma-glutamyl-phosphate reductase|nr:N-acetyl-gamma-glutamyl-phosphate reductase [Chloroflexota bacterium]MDP6758263.1 N-acetyl-gamma-glutamyl-phosphate reductase [Chloroflexota bacterium]